jgi:hypothetical protein
MALEKTISELTTKSGLIGDTDLLVISQVSDGVYSTKKVTGAQLKIYNTYLASISQSSTSAPTVNYEYSGLTSAISWAYISTGIYEATLTDAELTLNKTFLQISLGSGTIGFYSIFRTSTTKFRVSTYSSLGVLTNGLLLDSQIEIKIIK